MMPSEDNYSLPWCDDGNDEEEEDYLDADDGHSSYYRLKSANIAIVIDYSRYQRRGQKIGIFRTQS